MKSLLESVLRLSGRRENVPVSDRGNRASRLLARIVFLALAALVVSNATAQDSAYPAAASVLQPQAYVSLQPVPRGRAFQIAVVAKISPGFHINAHVPSEDYLIPTKITGGSISRSVPGGNDVSARSDARVSIFEDAPARLRRFLHGADETARERLRAARSSKNWPYGWLPGLQSGRLPAADESCGDGGPGNRRRGRAHASRPRGYFLRCSS